MEASPWKDSMRRSRMATMGLMPTGTLKPLLSRKRAGRSPLRVLKVGFMAVSLTTSHTNMTGMTGRAGLA